MPENSPVVTGISPAEGPPGTKVKIRGENLGKNADDLLGSNYFCDCYLILFTKLSFHVE